jgi:2,3-dihydro-2,3-dihydroxybenzoate dehydrogenase
MTRLALISGAAQGIGAAVARALADDGIRIAALDVDAEALRHLGGARHFPADVRDPVAVRSTVDEVERRLGPIDILVNVAGVLHVGSVLDTAEEDWQRVFDVNAGGVYRLSRAVAERMVTRRRGVIVTVASNAAGVARSQMAAYAASKAAAAHFTRCLGLELAPSGIRCNVVSPGSTDTRMQHGMDPALTIGGRPELFKAGIPLGRIADPSDVAAAVRFLVSDQARHITMHDLYVDGGASLR